MGIFSHAARQLGLMGLGLVALAACAGLEARAPLSCPPVRAYSRDFQLALKAEFDRLPANDPLHIVLLDYEALRDASRACAGAPQTQGAL